MSDKQIILDAAEEIAVLKENVAHLTAIIKERKLAGYVFDLGGVDIRISKKQFSLGASNAKPVYYISDEFDAAGFLIAPEVKIEQ